MNNVWTSIAIRAHSAAPQARARPLLELFNGYAKSTSTRSFAHWSTAKPARLWNSSIALSPVCYKAPISTSSCLAAKSKQRSSTRKTEKPPPPQNRAEKARKASENEAKLQPAQTVATHTEGLPAEAESEQLSWRDYAPEGGMPLPDGERSQPQINAIFQGEEIDVDTGNYILSVMHWRRMSGALIDVGLDFPKNSGVTSDQALKGLLYVRTVLPNVDESANGQTWAEEERQRLQEDIQARAVKLGLYKAPEGEEPEPDSESEAVPEESQQGTAKGRERSGESVLIQTRKANESAFEVYKAEKERKEAQLAVNAIAVVRGPLDLAGGVIPIVHSVQVTTQVKGPLGLKFNLPRNINIGAPQTKAWLAPVERKPWVKYYEQQAEIIKENVVPQMSAFKRLAPSFPVLLAVLAGCYYLSENYTPPPKSARVFPDSPPAVATLYALTGILFASFLLGRMPPFWRSYNKYMTVVPAYPYALSIIGAAFRHDTVKHLISNVMSLWLFGLMLHDDVGRGTFLAIYLASGVMGSYASLAWNVATKQWMTYVFGASGSIFGVASAACTLHPNATMNIFGYDVPISAWVFLSIFGGLELAAAMSRMKTTIDHAGHLGGITMGIAAAGALRLRAQQQGSAEMQRVDNPPELANKADEDA